MQPFCFGRENKEKGYYCIVGYFTIWEHNSKHIRVDDSQYKMQNYLEHHKTTISISVSLQKLLYNPVVLEPTFITARNILKCVPAPTNIINKKQHLFIPLS